MGHLSVSGLDDRIIRALEQRAARTGRSVEAEHRSLLEEVLGPESESFADTAAPSTCRLDGEEANRLAVGSRAIKP